MDLRLRGKRALVTGSSAGIGAEIASPLADPVSGAEYLIDCGYSVSGFRRQVDGRPVDAVRGEASGATA